MSEPLPAAFVDLPPEAFPFVIRFFDQRGREVYTHVVTDLGAIRIPPLSSTYGPVHARIDWPQGYRTTSSYRTTSEGRP